ncbi:MAG: 3-phosphoshikimate 1-carboxyvinyltransferase [Prevotellaceae bacterium]|jgi:3-phosphoshikimate 1-carboxyvinyltransferase|nr:3-phosphoshikimate 1-carboxyvinyltransferase [Prevotellaceae bacterium]
MSAQKHIEITLPASKSIVNRLLIIEALSGQKIVENKDISCDDTEVLLQALHFDNQTINAKFSGAAMRFLTAFFAQKEGEWILTGEKSLLLRPVNELVEALKILGADIQYLENEGFLPLKIVGKKLHSKTLKIENSQSSQTISALMLIAPMLHNGLTIKIKNVSSFPYILLTKKIMENCGAKIKIVRKRKFCLCPTIIANPCHCGSLPAMTGYIKVFPKKYFPKKFPIEADWSAAAFWYACAAMFDTKPIILKGLLPDSYQPDSVVKNIFENFGITSSWHTNLTDTHRLILEKNRCKSVLSASSVFKYSFKNCPDLVPALAVTCCANNVKFIFSGVKNLKIKESDRLAALVCELRNCGFMLKNSSDFIFWNGEKCVQQNPIKIETYNDHRIAMAFAILSQKIGLEIINRSVVEKSYRNFWQDFCKIAKK